MKNRLSGLPGVALGAALGVPGVMSKPLKELVTQLTDSARGALKDKGCTDLNLVAVARLSDNTGEHALTVSAWRTELGLKFRAMELKDELSDKKVDRLCIVGPHGPDGENNFFCYAEDTNGCWFGLMPVSNGELGQPDFRPSIESDGFHQLLPNALFS